MNCSPSSAHSHACSADPQTERFGFARLFHFQPVQFMSGPTAGLGPSSPRPLGFPSPLFLSLLLSPSSSPSSSCSEIPDWPPFQAASHLTASLAPIPRGPQVCVERGQLLTLGLEGETRKGRGKRHRQHRCSLGSRLLSDFSLLWGTSTQVSLCHQEGNGHASESSHEHLYPQRLHPTGHCLHPIIPH